MSLRTRLILSYVLIVFICLLITGVSVTALLQRYRDQTMVNRLQDVSRPIFTQVKSLLKGQTTVLDLWSDVQAQAQANKIYILLVDGNGKLVRGVSPDGKNAPVFNVPDGLPHNINQPAQGIFTTAGGQKFVYAAYPLAKSDLILPRPDTLVICEPRGSVAVIMAGVIRPFIWAGILALAISVLLAFLMTRSIYHPIQRLSKAAGNIAQGKYDETVPVSGPSEIRGLAVSFNEMARKVQASQQQLRHFVADVSHQLKTPLTSIKGFAQAMLDGTANDEETKQKATQIIVDESNRMIRQVNELLELSRMQAGQVKIAREPVDIKELLLHCQDIFALRADEKKIRIIGKIDAPLNVIGDVDRLEDVFSNLLDNALKNTPPEGEIRILSRKPAADTRSVEITISDTGPGIPPEQIPHVFERFSQTSGLRTGHGLGLAIAREIILAHGGRIEVASSPGEGASFTVTLPVTSSVP